MSEEQVEAILREVYSFLMLKGLVTDEDWRELIEPRIRNAKKRIAKLSN